nr:aminotransferase class I/II-fold pyridoxal phosphate-dependent enzyme [Bacilli bacterium]
YSFSKCLSLPGERIGYIVLNPISSDVNDVYAAMCGAGSMLGYICAPTLFQHMIPYCLGYTSDLSVYKKNRDTLYNALKEMGYEVIYPRGAFYLFMRALEKDAIKFSEIAKEYELLLVPSDPFDYQGYVRIAYCVSYQTIINSLPAFKKLYKRYKNK